MNRVDPRERGLIGAAWYSGYIARAAAAGVDALTLAATSGPSGIVYTKQPHSQPWFDDGSAKVYPHYHVIAGATALAGREVLAAENSDARVIQVLAFGGKAGVELRITNLTGADQTVRLTGVPQNGQGMILDETTFEAACRDPDWRRNAARVAVGETLTLKPYAIAEIHYG
jgi:hypothetical protein